MMTVDELRDLIAKLPGHLVVRVWAPHDLYDGSTDTDCLDVYKAEMENLKGCGCFLALHAPHPFEGFARHPNDVP